MLADNTSDRPRRRIDDALVSSMIIAGKSARHIAERLAVTPEGVRKSATRCGLRERLRANQETHLPAVNAPLTQDRIKVLLSYDPTTGEFTRNVRRPGKSAGSIAGSNKKSGYRMLSVDGRLYYEHRLAWLYIYGAWPRGLIDHINRNRADNRIENLRECDASLNAQNAITPRGGKVLPLGVFQYGNVFASYITVDRKRHYLGRFPTAEGASAAYQAAKSQLHAGAVQ